MTFRTKYRHFKYIVMLFELKNVLIIFQQLINNTIQKYLNVFVITYLNDILIYSDTLKKHQKHVQKMLKRLNKKVLYINKKKSWFETQKVCFLKYVIWLRKIVQNSQKIKAVINWLKFTKLKKMQIFLSLVNYYWQYVM